MNEDKAYYDGDEWQPVANALPADVKDLWTYQKQQYMINTWRPYQMKGMSPEESQRARNYTAIYEGICVSNERQLCQAIASYSSMHVNVSESEIESYFRSSDLLIIENEGLQFTIYGYEWGYQVQCVRSDLSGSEDHFRLSFAHLYPGALYKVILHLDGPVDLSRLQRMTKDTFLTHRVEERGGRSTLTLTAKNYSPIFVGKTPSEVYEWIKSAVQD